MQTLINKPVDTWIRPWNKERFDDLVDRDERFFSIVIKGALSWLTRNIVLYNKPIKHFIFSTGSTIMYVEDNGYEYSETETSGENWMYSHIPCCACEIGDFQIQTDDLSSPFSRGIYERKSSIDNQFHGYNAEIRRLPIEISLTCKYILNNFNESLILIQELFDKLVFQKYFKIVYLGQVITCSIEFPTSSKIEFEKIDMTVAQDKTKKVELELKILTSYPQIDIRSEMENSNVISKAGVNVNLYADIVKNKNDEENYLYD